MTYARPGALSAAPFSPFTSSTMRALLFLPLLAACGDSTKGTGTSTETDSGVVLPNEDSGVVLPSDDSGTDAAETGTSLADAGVIAVPLYVCSGAAYVASATIGGSQTFELIIDTGSTTLGVAGASCTSCGVSPEYTPGASAMDTNMTTTADYGTGQWMGTIYDDKVSLGSSPATSFDFASITSQQGFFTPTMCNSPGGGTQGIIGLGPSAAADQGTTGFFDALVQATKLPNVFATELCANGGTLWLGGYDPSATTAAPQYTPITSFFDQEYYYSVNLVSISVAGATAAIGTTQYPGSAVDTGTNLVILPTDAFTTLTNAIGGDAAFESIFGDGSGNASSFFNNPGEGVMTTQTKAELDAMLPEVTMVFGTSPAITVTATATESYLYGYGAGWYPALQPDQDNLSDVGLVAILGAPILRSNVVIFDRANSRIGFAPHAACP